MSGCWRGVILNNECYGSYTVQSLYFTQRTLFIWVNVWSSNFNSAWVHWIFCNGRCNLFLGGIGKMRYGLVVWRDLPWCPCQPSYTPPSSLQEQASRSETQQVKVRSLPFRLFILFFPTSLPFFLFLVPICFFLLDHSLLILPSHC